MKQILTIVLFFSFLITACVDKKTPVEASVNEIDTIPMLVTQVQQCSRLYTTEYHIHKIVTHDDKLKLSGRFMKQDFNVNLPLGERRIAIPMDATLKAYIDLSGFSDKNIKRRGRELIVTLPDPKIILTSTKIDHKEVKQYVALTRHNFTDAELTSYELQGRKQIISSIPQMGIVHQAQQSAARQLVPIFTAMGYKEKDITISFRKTFSIKDLGSMIEVNNRD
ncbi:DUF4230 domain-containing protein [uncultured Prevotella sp.]|nr:DUF4230 domain-containing protein [uncultured Prevotella sp.]